MTYEELIAYYGAQGKANPFQYRPDQLATDLGYSGTAQTQTGWGGSPSESTGQGTEAQYALTPDFETFLQGYNYQPATSGGRNAAMDVYDKSGALVRDDYRVGDHKGTAMKIAGTVIPALAMAGFGAGVGGLMGYGPMAAPGAGVDAWGATLGNSLDGMSLMNTGAGGYGGMIGPATGVEALAGGVTQAGVNAAALGPTGSLLGGAAGGMGGGLVGAGIGAATSVSPLLSGVTQADVNGAALGPNGSLPGLQGGSIPWGQIGSQALSLGSQLYGSNQAANQMQAATTQANDLQKYTYDTTRADNAPALAARNSALSQMQALLKDPSTLTQQPGYQFSLNEGTKALNSGAAARGMTYSGAQGKALQRYGQDYAGTKLDASFNRLSSLANAGQPGAGQIGAATANYGNNVGANTMQQGDANAMKYLVGGNALGTAVNGLTAYGQQKGWWQP